MKASRRSVLLAGTAAGVVAVAEPGEAIASPPIQSTKVSTLTSLAAEGKFASVNLSLPDDVMTSDWHFTLNGKPCTDDYAGVVEIYAPGDDSGWAVVYLKETEAEPGYRRQALVRGNWGMTKTHRSSRAS